jgi:hypothetical protein
VAKNAMATLYDDNGLPVATTQTGKGSPIFGALCVSDNGVPLQTTTGGTTTAVVASGVGTTVIKATAGRLCRVVVTNTPATNPLTFYDNASTGTGTVIGIVPGSATQGQVFDFNMPAALGITAIGAATSAAVTVSFV